MFERLGAEPRPGVVHGKLEPCILHRLGCKGDCATSCAGIAGVQHQVEQRVLQHAGIQQIAIRKVDADDLKSDTRGQVRARQCL